MMDLPETLKIYPDWSQLEPLQLKACWKAANQLVKNLQQLSQNGQQVVQSMLNGQECIEWEHYPENDVRDELHASQYYYHAHSGLQRPFTEHGHFHLFIHAQSLGMRSPARHYQPAPAHLVAVSMDANGLPCGFFTVNRWVTKGAWLNAKEIETGIQHFQIKKRSSTRQINQFLKSLLDLYRHHLKALIFQRDEIMQQLCSERDRRSVFSDKKIEVLSYCPINLIEDITQLEQMIASKPGKN